MDPIKYSSTEPSPELHSRPLPTLWLLGKTGAGKSSFIQFITGASSVEVGNGFEPCTKTASMYDFPQDKPIMRFLDTRGLGEANYDPTADLNEMAKRGNAVIVLMKADEPEQSAVLSALKQIRKEKKIKHLLLIHSAVLLSSEADRLRQITFNEQQVRSIWKKQFNSVSVDFETTEGVVYNEENLLSEIIEIVPIVALLAQDKAHANLEKTKFGNVQKEILWYCGSAAASDLVPGVGLVSVPAIHAKMLHSLAKSYAEQWNTQTFRELISTLGTSFALQYSAKLGARQLVKFIPVYGQTVGALAAASMSFATTYGLGRVACYYFYHKQKGEKVSDEKMQDLYKNAFKKGKAAAGYEKP